MRARKRRNYRKVDATQLQLFAKSALRHSQTLTFERLPYPDLCSLSVIRREAPNSENTGRSNSIAAYAASRALAARR